MSDNPIVALGLGALLVAGGIAVGNASKNIRVNQAAVRQATEKVVDDYFREHPVHISEEVVNSAAERSVNVQVGRYVDRVGKDISNAARTAIQRKVDDVYHQEEGKIVGKFSEELSNRVHSLNSIDIRKTVVKKTAEKFEEKLDETIDQEIDNYFEEKAPEVIKRTIESTARRKWFW